MKNICYILTACFVFLVIGCQKEMTTPKGSVTAGVAVKVQVSFKIPKFTKPDSGVGLKSSSGNANNLFSLSLNDNDTNTKAGSTPAPLYNLWVFQFGTDNKTVKISKVSTTESPVNESVTVEADLMTGDNQTIYLLALGKKFGAIDLSKIGSLEELELTTFDFVRYENGFPVAIIQHEEDVPYRGSCSGISIIQLEKDGAGFVDYKNSNNFSGSIGMRALVSLVNFDFTYNVTGMTPHSLQMNNVPTTFTVNDDKFKPSQFVNLAPIMFNADDLSGNKRYTASWYVAPNQQGVVMGMKESDRYFYYDNNGVAKGTAPRDGSYLHFWAKVDNVADRYALYYIFLGGNTNNDFNLLPHSLYKYKTDINSADDLNDKRIIYKTLKQSVDFSVSAYTTTQPALARVNSAYDFDSHADMRPIEVTALRGTVLVEILNGVNDVNPADISNTWLRLSTYPNYTAALTAQKSGSTSGLTTSITLDASIPGLFKLYLYSDEWEKYITTNPSVAGEKRSLFVRFTFKTSSGVSQVYTARMDQRPAFYVGQWGGDFIPSVTGAQYTKGLVMENIKDMERYLSYYPSSYNVWLAYGGISESDVIKNGGYDLYVGRDATVSMAENKHKLSSITSGTHIPNLQLPSYAGGHVDLYQYKYYTGDSFAQRYCYDKNRDINGNGYLDKNEIVWYMPAYGQIMPFIFNYYSQQFPYYADGPSSLFSLTMINTTNFVGFSKSQISNATFTHNSLYNTNLRCVRDVELIAGGVGGAKCSVEDGYAVIDISGLPSDVTEDRTKNPNIVNGRVKRYYYSENAILNTMERVSSIRFMVAPKDIDKAGNHATKYEFMGWAEAAGYDTAVNTKPIDTNADGTAETGCPVYRGKDGTDDVGTWRLPTVYEMNLIALMDQAMEATSPATGYNALNSGSSGYYQNYWTAAEEYTTTVGQNKAMLLYTTAKVSGPVGNKYARRTSSSSKSLSSSNESSVRCVKDLAPKAP